MKSFIYKFIAITSIILMANKPEIKEFKGQAIYFSKAKMELGNFGARLSDAQKKQIQSRLKNRLEKSYVLNFNKTESVFVEEDKVDAISGATDSWGSNFSRGKQYKNIKDDKLIQSQEFYGKKFLVKDKLQKIDWKVGSESKQIGNYTCFKATASVPTSELTWFDFSWGNVTNTSNSNEKEDEIKMTEVEAWYTLQIPVSHGPAEYWGLPGLILEVSAGNTTMLCSRIVINPKERIEIQAPKKGKVINKENYQKTIQGKMVEMRNNRGRRRN